MSRIRRRLERYGHMESTQPKLQIGDLDVSPNMILSPMSGVTDMPFRRLVRRCSSGHVGLVVTEFIAVEQLSSGVSSAHNQIRFAKDEHPIAVQVFGSARDPLLRAGELIQSRGADIIDVNCGCPAPKVVKQGGGAGLLRQLETLHNLLCALTSNLDIPVTLKIRNGWRGDQLVAEEVLALAEDAGVKMLAIHGRTREQLYRGKADWDIVKRLAATATIPVVGSGDVKNWGDALGRLDETRCAGIMIGRAAIKNPFIFRQIHEARTGQEIFTPGLEDIIHGLECYLSLLHEHHQPKRIKARMKRMSAAMIRGYPGSAKLRTRLFQCSDPDTIIREVQHFLERHPNTPAPERHLKARLEPKASD